MSGTGCGRKLGRTSSHRTALYRNMTTSLIKYEQIKTTEGKAKSLRPFVEKLITLAKKTDLSTKRRVMQDIKDREIVKKLFETIAPRFASRNGGYTKIIKLNNRFSDNAKMCIIKLLQ
jgi:large subunit ribosomal protein L17